MAHYFSTMTHSGAQALARMMAYGSALKLTRAECGQGRPTGEPKEAAALISPIAVSTSLVGASFHPGTPPIMKILVQASNLGLLESAYVREIGVYARGEDDKEFLCFYAWLSGEDSDNVLPPAMGDEADTIHSHDIAVIVTDSQSEGIDVKVTPGGFALAEQLEELRWQTMRHIVRQRPRDASRPDYGLGGGTVAVTLEAVPYTGAEEVGIVADGRLYAVNMSQNGASAPNGTIIIKKLEE